MQFRIPVATLPGTYADGEIITAEKLNLIVNVLRTGVNANFNDYLKIIAGNNQIYAATTLEALQTIGESLGAADAEVYGIVLNGIEDEESPDIQTLMLYQFDYDPETETGTFVQVFGNTAISFIGILERADEIEAAYTGIVADFPNGIKDVTDDLQDQIDLLESNKVDKVTGKALSTEDFTTTLKNKLDGIEAGSQVNDLETIQLVGYGATPNVPINVPITSKNATIDLSLKADLVDGFVPASQLPSFVDQIIEVANFAALPPTGEDSKIYITLNDHKTFRWSGTGYVEVSPSLALGETSETAYRGDRGATAYTHSQIINGTNPHGTTLANVAGVTLTSPTNGQVLKYNGTVWVNGQDNDLNYYFSGASFNVNTGVLTLTGAGGQSNLTPDLDGRYYVSLDGRIVWSDIDLPTDLVTYGLSDLVATKNHLHDDRYPVLDVNGKIQTSNLPPLAITETFVVATQEAQDLLTPQTGDVAIRTDLKKSFIYTGSAWQELLTPTDIILSVNNKTGAVTLTAADVGSPTTLEFTTLSGTVSTFINTTYAADKLAIEGDITALEGRATALETDSHTHANKSTLDSIAGIQTSITSTTSEYDNQLATIGAIKIYSGNPDSTWQGQALFLRDNNGDYYPKTTNDANSVVIRDASGHVNIGYDNSDSTIVATTFKGAIDELDLRKADISLLNSNINLYPTDAAADVMGYFKMVTTFEDPDYDTTAVNIPTGSITTTAQLLASLVAPANLFVGNPGIVNVITIGNIRKTAGNANAFAEFYFEIYQRASNGTETLIATSDTTGAVNPNNGNYREFSASAVLNNGTFVSTDRIVIKYYANSIGAGAEYDFQFGGTSPVRTLIPVPVSVIPAEIASGVVVDASGFSGVLGEDDVNVQHALETLDAHNHDGVYQPAGDYATNTYVNGLLAGADAMIFKGTIGTGGTVTALPVPYNAGWTYKVITAGTYAGKNTEVGDLLVATADQTVELVNSEWTVVQTNIDGAVTGPVSSTDNHVAIFDGASGKIIKDSGFTLGKSVPTDAVFTDTVYTHPSGFSSKPDTALTGANVISQVTVNTDGHVTGTSTRALTPSDISAASSSELSSLSGVVDGKVTANANITGATKTKITYDAKGLVTAGGDLAESDIPMLPISKITNLQTNLDGKATTIDYSTTLPSTGWSGSGPYTIDVTTNLGAIVSTDKPIIDLDMTSVSFANVDSVNTEWAKVYRAASGAGKITFYAKEVPTVALALQVKVVK